MKRFPPGFWLGLVIGLAIFDAYMVFWVVPTMDGLLAAALA